MGRPIDAEPVEIVPGTAVSAATAHPDGPIELRCRHTDSQTETVISTEAVVLATGYRAVRPPVLDPIAHLIDWDDQGRYQVDLDHRVATLPALTGGLYVQNAELNTHGVGTPDLGLGARRAAVILNSVAGGTVHPLPTRSAWTNFAPSTPAGSRPQEIDTAPAHAAR
ncbi:SidA/IucD/PvdA family monooxygenase [Streptomyces sp. NPDC088747]|uniref:SidA/IucD/PvdA family monooxygenase n=1 Tax=Streptomyces sp. NPDC088747 TaxID=3365886 RepID=UPI0038258AD3